MNGDQSAYWDAEGPKKTFTHPVNWNWLRERLAPTSKILDFGCGYGRAAAVLAAEGFGDVIGVDFSVKMIEKAKRLHPTLEFQTISGGRTPFADGEFDAILLFAVLTCVPGDAEQREAVAELRRILRSGGILYVSDYWLQTDARNLERYERDAKRFGAYGTFEIEGGAIVRHHSRERIDELFRDWERIEAADISVVTMNGHESAAFQALYRAV